MFLAWHNRETLGRWAGSGVRAEERPHNSASGRRHHNFNFESGVSVQVREAMGIHLESCWCRACAAERTEAGAKGAPEDNAQHTSHDVIG